MKNILEQVAEAAQLREGAEGVRRMLECAGAGRGGDRCEGLPLKDLARAVGLPLPVASAVRRELEKLDVFHRDGGVRLTEKGGELAAELGIFPPVGCVCAGCAGKKIVIPDEFRPALAELRAAAEKMPTVDVTLDQAYALPETAMRRALYALECGALSGRNVAFFGDDDLVSLAASLVLKQVAGDKVIPGNLVVFEVDRRITTLVKEESARMGTRVECVAHDLREPIPEKYRNAFHTFFTDPPYTPEGLRLFLSRGAQALEQRTGMQGFLSFAHRDPDSDMELFSIIGEHGFAPMEVTPGFNFYSGAELIGNTSRMIKLVSGTSTRATVEESFSGMMYSGDFNVTRRIYECAGCRRKYKVGKGAKYKTIEKLKMAGCPNCGESKFILKDKKALKELRIDEKDSTYGRD